jgi:transcriptional regulator with XRE-family HTH domain
MGSKTWDDLKRKQFTEDERERIRFEAAIELAELRLGELRQKLGVTQAELAERMEAAQPHLSKIENSEDFYLSTLKRYIQALGGRLELRAVFDGEEQIALRV